MERFNDETSQLKDMNPDVTHHALVLQFKIGPLLICWKGDPSRH